MTEKDNRSTLPQGNVEKHDYEPDTEDTRYRGDPHCRVCGEAKRMPLHYGE